MAGAGLGRLVEDAGPWTQPIHTVDQQPTDLAARSC
jgi:hypothetical protein